MLFRNIDRIMSLGDVMKKRTKQNLLLYDKHGQAMALVVTNKKIDWDGIVPFWEEPVRVTGIENKNLWAATFLNINEEIYFQRKKNLIITREGRCII